VSQPIGFQLGLCVVAYEPAVLVSAAPALSELVARLGHAGLDQVWRLALARVGRSAEMVMPFAPPSNLTSHPSTGEGSGRAQPATRSGLTGLERACRSFVEILEDDGFTVAMAAVLLLVGSPPGSVRFDDLAARVGSVEVAVVTPDQGGAMGDGGGRGRHAGDDRTAAAVDLLGDAMANRIIHPTGPTTLSQLLAAEGIPVGAPGGLAAERSGQRPVDVADAQEPVAVAAHAHRVLAVLESAGDGLTVGQTLIEGATEGDGGAVV
jgi:hypothetical protein